MLWRKDLAGTKVINVEDSRLSGWEIMFDNQIIVYLPCNSPDNLDDFVYMANLMIKGYPLSMYTMRRETITVCLAFNNDSAITSTESTIQMGNGCLP